MSLIYVVPCCSFLIHAGIGRAVVKALAQCGAEVISFSRTQADLDSLKTEVRLSVYASNVLLRIRISIVNISLSL